MRNFNVKSKQWIEDIKKYGVIPNKTYSAYLPEIRPDLMPHLIRGLIDGDGWISYKSHSIGLCGNISLVEQVRDYMVNTLNVYNVKVIQTEPHLWMINWASYSEVIRICNYIYQDKSDCYIARKYNNFLKIASKYRDKFCDSQGTEPS